MSKKLFPILLSLVLLIGLLSACSDTSPAPTATPQGNGPNKITSGPVPTPTPKPLVQPKVVQSVPDPRGTIDFTELPDLQDGWPTLLWFDAANSMYSSQMQPIYDSLKATYSTRVKFANLNYDNEAYVRLLEEYHITSQPAFVLFDHTGKAVKSWIGLVVQQDLDNNLKSVSNF